MNAPELTRHTVQVDRSVSPASVAFPDVFNVSVPLLDSHMEAGRADKIMARWMDRTLCYGQLHDSVLRLGNALRAMGIQPGERVALFVKDTEAYYQAFLAAIRIGAVAIPVNTFLRAKDYAYILKDSEARAVFASDGTIEEVKAALSEHGIGIPHLIATDSAHEGWQQLDEVLGGAVAECEPAETSAASPCFWLYSSGSTGSPKASVHEHKDMIFAAEHFGVGVVGLSAEDVIFSAPKLFFAYGVGNSFCFPLYVGATALLVTEKPTPDNTIDMINAHRPTVYFGVPTLYAAQAAAVSDGRHLDPGRLRFCHSGGEALPAALFQRWKDLTGLTIYDGIGSSEALHIYTSNRPGDLKLGSSGRVVPGYQACVVDADGNEVGLNEPGELWIKGDSVTRFYWNKPEKNAEAFVDGWFRTGDTVFLDEDGFFHFCGRGDDMLKVGGIWVAPFEVESALTRHPAVLEVAVVGAPDENGLIKPKAYCVLRDPTAASQALADELITFTKTFLAPFKYPRWVEFIDELPKTASGKIQRFQLRDAGGAAGNV